MNKNNNKEYLNNYVPSAVLSINIYHYANLYVYKYDNINYCMKDSSDFVYDKLIELL